MVRKREREIERWQETGNHEQVDSERNGEIGRKIEIETGGEWRESNREEYKRWRERGREKNMRWKEKRQRFLVIQAGSCFPQTAPH